MHLSEIDSNALTDVQIDQFYNLAVEMFPGKAADLAGTMRALDEDGADNREKFRSLLGSVFDWFHYGN